MSENLYKKEIKFKKKILKSNLILKKIVTFHYYFS